MTWSEAFLRQAASDFEVHELLSLQPHLPRCHGLHYLQMAVEKLVKSFLCHGASGPPRESHAVVTSFIRSCASNRRLRDRFQMQHQPFSSMLRKHARVAEYIENLAPAMSDKSMRSILGRVLQAKPLRHEIIILKKCLLLKWPSSGTLWPSY